MKKASKYVSCILSYQQYLKSKLVPFSDCGWNESGCKRISKYRGSTYLILSTMCSQIASVHLLDYSKHGSLGIETNIIFVDFSSCCIDEFT